MKTPCRNCDNRKVGCHITCLSYKEFREKLEKANKKKQKDREVMNALIAKKARNEKSKQALTK